MNNMNNMNKHNEVNKIVELLAENLGVNVIDVKGCLNNVTDIFNDDTQNNIKLAEMATQKYEGEFFDLTKELSCGCGKALLHVVTIIHQYDSFFIAKGTLISSQLMLIGNHDFSIRGAYEFRIYANDLSDFEKYYIDKSKAKNIIDTEYDHLGKHYNNIFKM